MSHHPFLDINNQMAVTAINHFPMSVMSQTERENCEPMDSGRLPFVWWQLPLATQW